MANQYSIECPKGHRMRVELYEAGTTKTCPVCNSSLFVPNTNTLKELSGDKYPLLRPLDKIKKLLEMQEPPFDGTCQKCQQVKAEVLVPVNIHTLTERRVSDNQGIRPSLHGISITVSDAEETWEVTSFPLLLCDQCHADFESTQSRRWLNGTLKTIALVGLLVGFLTLAYFNFELVAVLANVLVAVATVAFVMSNWRKKKLESSLTSWVELIRWAPEAISESVEHRIVIDAPQPFSRQA